jgi:hypothetical protein
MRRICEQREDRQDQRLDRQQIRQRRLDDELKLGGLFNGQIGFRPSRIGTVTLPDVSVRVIASPHAETALLPTPFWCTKRVETAHFDWR